MEKKKKIRKGRRKGKKGSKGRENRKNTQKKSSGKKETDKSPTKKPSSSSKDMDKKDKKKSSNRGKKDSEEEKEEKPPPVGKKRKNRGKKKDKNPKEDSTQQDKDIITKDPSKEKSTTNKPEKMKHESEKTKLDSEKKDSIASEKASKTSRKNSKSKSGKKGRGSGRSSVNKAFSVFTGTQTLEHNDMESNTQTLEHNEMESNTQTLEHNEMEPNKSISKTEAERQIDALTDEQLVYALKVAEKRFKRTDRRIKRRLSALKEMTIQHLNALESLEMSLDQRSSPLKSNPMSNRNYSSNSLSTRPMNKVTFYQNKGEMSLSKNSLNFKSNAKNFLQFASRTSQKLGTIPTDENRALENENDPPNVSRKRPAEDKNMLTSNSQEISSTSREKTDDNQKELSSKGSQKNSNKKSRKKRRKHKGRKNPSSSNKKNDKNILSIGNIFKSKMAKKTDRDSKSKKLKIPPQNSKAEKNDQGDLSQQFMSKSQRGRSQSGRPQRRRNNGYSRNERYEYIRDRERNRKIQMVLPRLNRSIREITRRLYHVLKPFTTNIKLSDTYYQAIFNTTRYDIIKGARDILQDINDANDDVYDAVMRASHLARSIYMKARRNRAAQRPGVLNEEAYRRAVESKVKRRNFRPHLQRLAEQQQKLGSHTQDLQMMEMKSRQLKSRYVQVHERFLEKYDHQAFRHLFDNMRSTIYILNNGLRKSYLMKQFHKSKKYVKSMRLEVTTARGILANSTEVYRNGMMKYMENERIVWSVKKGKRDLRRRKRMLSDSPGPGLTSRQYQRLDLLVVKTRKHAQRLNREISQIQRVLATAVRNAKSALVKLGRGNTVGSPLQIDLRSLKSVHEQTVMALDELRKFIGGKAEITLASLRGCKSNLDTDDEDFGCSVEGSGMEGSGDMTFVDSEEDFTFDGDLDVSPASKPNAVQLLGKELKFFTANMLKTSQHHFDSAQVIRESLEDLKDRWKGFEGKAAVTNQRANVETVITDGLAEAQSNSTTITVKIKRINQKISDLEEIDFEELHSKAEAAIESAKKNRKDNGEDENTDYHDSEENNESGSFGVTDLLFTGQSIISNRDSIKNLQTFAVDTIDKSNNRLKLLRGNITQLWEKVKVAKNLLNSMQLSILKEGKSPIVSTALSDDLKLSKSVTTSFSLCIKPQSLDGTVLYSAGNDSVSYALKLSDGKLRAYVYDEDNMELTDITLDGKLEADKWHTISLLRVGQTLNLTAAREDEVFTESVEVESMPDHQMAPSLSYIGGVPDNLKMSTDEPWEGCVGELLVNDKAMSLFNPTVAGNSTSLCSDHCVSQGKTFSWIFDGGGFVRYAWGPWESIESLSVQFTTKQSHAAILSAANERRRFHLLVTVANGAVQIESATRMESVVLLSLNNSFNDGKSHTLKIFFRDRGTYPELDGDVAAFSVENTKPTVLKKVQDGILLGAFISVEKFLGDLHHPLIGCASISSINEKSLLYDGILQSHNVYYGKCTMRSMWQSCVHFPDTSQPLSLGELVDSNKISMLVLRNSTGPLLLYVKEDDFEIELVLTEDGIDVSNGELEGELIRSEDYQLNELFDLITVEDGGDNVVVNAFGESTKFSYGGWFKAQDLSASHTIEIGQTRDGSDRVFTVSMSEFVIGGRIYDLTKHSSTHPIKACEVPDTHLKQNFPTETRNDDSNMR